MPSALQFTPIKERKSAMNTTCELCFLRSGRYRLTMANYPVGRVCRHCKNTWTKTWDELAS